jgi:hypothetical protein
MHIFSKWKLSPNLISFVYEQTGRNLKIFLALTAGSMENIVFRGKNMRSDFTVSHPRRPISSRTMIYVMFLAALKYFDSFKLVHVFCTCNLRKDNKSHINDQIKSKIIPQYRPYPFLILRRTPPSKFQQEIAETKLHQKFLTSVIWRILYMQLHL